MCERESEASGSARRKRAVASSRLSKMMYTIYKRDLLHQAAETCPQTIPQPKEENALEHKGSRISGSEPS